MSVRNNESGRGELRWTTLQKMSNRVFKSSRIYSLLSDESNRRKFSIETKYFCSFVVDDHNFHFAYGLVYAVFETPPPSSLLFIRPLSGVKKFVHCSCFAGVVGFASEGGSGSESVYIFPADDTMSNVYVL